MAQKTLQDYQMDWLSNLVGGAARVNLSTSTYGALAQEKSYSAEVIGTETAPVVIGISGNATSGFIDLRKFARDGATLIVNKTAGTGTYKIEAYVSADAGGIFKSELISLAVGLTVSKAVKFDQTTIPYGHFGQIIITETGGAASVTLSAMIVGRGGA